MEFPTYDKDSGGHYPPDDNAGSSRK